MGIGGVNIGAAGACLYRILEWGEEGEFPIRPNFDPNSQ